MKNKNEILRDLGHFTGTAQYYYLPSFSNFNYTDGVKYLAENAKCYWLLAYIFSYQSEPEIKEQEFQVWKIMVNEDSSAVIQVEDGNDNLIRSFDMPYTDFPLSKFTLWFENKVLFLPSER